MGGGLTWRRRLSTGWGRPGVLVTACRGPAWSAASLSTVPSAIGHRPSATPYALRPTPATP